MPARVRTAMPSDPRSEPRPALERLRGSSRAIARVRDQIRHLAATRATVLVEGEPGTGTSLAARAIHETSARRERPFVTVSASALPEAWLESELFGDERAPREDGVSRVGKIEQAAGGTLFLDDVDAVAPAIQLKLLRFLQDRSFERLGGSGSQVADVRMVTATHRDLADEVRAGHFREDLYYRLSAARIALPPLRERSEDLPRLTDMLLRELNKEHGSRVTGVTRGVLERFAAYPWPGNVRELRSTLEGMVAFVERRRALALSDLPLALRGVGGTVDRLETSVGMTVEEVERQLIAATLRYTRFDKPRAAAMLGIGLRTLYRKIQRYRLPQGTRSR
jgi:two-component system response regulator HydG